MAETKDLGRLFVHKIKLGRDAPRFHVWPSFETEWPYRSSRSLIFRLFGTRGIVLGWWRDNLDPDEEELVSLYRAMTGHDPDEDVEEKLLHCLQGAEAEVAKKSNL